MQRRRLLVALAGLSVVVAAVAVVLWPSRPNRITKENCDRIKEGMSRAEAESILGPPGDYSSGPLLRSDFVSLGDTAYSGVVSLTPSDLANLAPSKETSGSELLEPVEWKSDNGIACVYFRPTGQVREKHFSKASRISQTPVDALVWRLNRQWHRWFP
jgi:hypothetical protein